MAKDLIRRYVWLVDTLRSYGKITRQKIDTLWQKSPYSDGNPMPRRTFYHYRRAIEENFGLEINCDSAGRYYISEEESPSNSYTDWLLDSFAVNSALKDSGDAQCRIQVESVPSAREFLPRVLDAIRDLSKINFTYASFNRSRAERGIVLSPYFLKRYKQRWYMVGKRDKTGDMRTYALDRVRELHILDSHFEIPTDVSVDSIFGEIIGITSTKGETKRVRLMTTPTQAKYMRALPLHDSQTEEIHDDFSIFTYNLKLNWELVHEILGFGQQVKVLDPPELQLMVVEDLKRNLEQYERR